MPCCVLAVLCGVVAVLRLTARRAWMLQVL